MRTEKSVIFTEGQVIEIPTGAIVLRCYHQFNIDTQKMEFICIFEIPEENGTED